MSVCIGRFCTEFIDSIIIILGLTYTEVHIPTLACTEWTLDLENGISVSICNGELWIYESAVLFDPANGGPRWRLDFHFLQAAEETEVVTAERPHQMNHL